MGIAIETDLISGLRACFSCRHGDALEAVLGQESENGRIARLLIKLGFVNERPDVGVVALRWQLSVWSSWIALPTSARRRSHVGRDWRPLHVEAVQRLRLPSERR